MSGLGVAILALFVELLLLVGAFELQDWLRDRRADALTRPIGPEDRPDWGRL